MQRGITEIYGYYYPTPKNAMVKDFFSLQDFEKISEDEDGNTVWKFNIAVDYVKKNDVIRIIK